MFEIELPGPADGNPFLDVEFSAVFTQGSNVLTVPGFYDGDGIYKVRFMLEKTGEWQYLTQSSIRY